MKDNYKKLIIFISLLAIPLSVFALELNYPTINGTSLNESMGLSDLVKYAFNFAVAAGSVIALFVIIAQGLNIAGSAGDVTKVGAAKSKIINAAIGLAVILASYIILTVINPELIAIKDISIQIFPPQEPGETPSAPENPPSSGGGTISFQEIPLGTLTENALASEMNCADKDKNLIDCITKKIIDCYYEGGDPMNKCKVKDVKTAKPKDIFLPGSSPLYCYTYDSDGDKSGTLKNWDRLSCFENTLEAFQIKMETLADYTSQLSALISQCSCSNCTKGTWYPAADCPGGCTSRCECETGPYKESKDPCPNRAAIDTMREKIKQLINGGDRDDDHYDWHMNPYPDPKEEDPVKKLEYNSKFMTLELFMEKLADFNRLFQGDYDALDQAENMMKANPEVISLAQLQNIEYYNSQSVSVNHFSEQSIDKYCRDFDTGLTSLGRICKIADEKERYLFDGDPNTFYSSAGFSLEREYGNTADTVEQCSLSGGGEIGPIPIGTVIDGTKDLISQLMDSIDNLTIRENTAIGLSLDASDSTYNLPEKCECTNCRSRMQEFPYQCCANCLDALFLQKEHCIEATCLCEDKSSAERVCPFGSFSSNQSRLAQINENIDDKILEISGIIDSGRFSVLEKLSDSRRKLESCVSGFRMVEKPDILQTRVISCQQGLLDIHLKRLVILPGFPWPQTQGYYNCYPFNSPSLTAEQKLECYRNFTGEGGAGSPKCQDFIKGLMNDYYCCE